MTQGALVGVLLVATMLLVVLAGWLSWTARRLDRMHLRCAGAAAAVDAAVTRRRALVLDAAGRPDTDPAIRLLLADAWTDEPIRAAATGAGRWQHESDLSAVLRAVWPPGPHPTPWVELAAAAHRVSLARRIHNDLATTAQALHERRRVRWLHLAGHAKAPDPIAFDDTPPG